MNIKISQIVNTSILNSEWVGFHGDSEYVDADGEVQMGYWTFRDISDDGVIIPFELDDEIPEGALYEDYLIPIRNKNGNICVVEFHYRSDLE